MTSRLLWVRWSWRDLRHRWPLVTAIALVIALGTGTYAALLGTSEWRRQSNDASFGMLHVHDLRIALTQGSTVPEGTLAALVAQSGITGDVTGLRERLLVPTQVSGPGGLLVPGELVGTASDGPPVDAVHVYEGRALTAADDGAPVVVVETQFANENALPTAGELVLSGGSRVESVGLGTSPEYFMVSGGQGALPFLSQKSYGVLFTSLHSAQQLSGQRGLVNDVVLTLRPGSDAATAERTLRQALATADPPLGGTVSDRRDIDAYRVLYDDIDSDAKVWRVIALLVLLGAALAALNLTTRIVEAQRREIGIGMALGVPTRYLTVRPVLFGAQVAFIGVALGIAVGLLVGIPLKSVFTEMLPLPQWRTPFQYGVFLQAAALGFLLPFAAVAWPVWRAVRVEPVDAIRVGHLAARGGGLAPLLRRLPLPGRSFRQVPVRNVLRTPRRTALTALGIAAAITTLTATVGFLDTFGATLDRSADELLTRSPTRISVSLTTFEPRTGDVVSAVTALPESGRVTAGVLLPTTARTGQEPVELFTEVLPDDPVWSPTLIRGDTRGGIVLAQKAAADLDVGIGDEIRLEHPQVTDTGLTMVESRIRVVGLHPNPMRVMAYVDSATGARFGFGSLTNMLTVLPADGATGDEVRRALLGVPRVASAESVRTTTDAMQSSLDEFQGILQVAAAVTLLLALLIAFNTASIAMDERGREHATMVAFGLPVRTVLGMSIVETALIGAAGTLAGVAGGYLVLDWLTAVTWPEVMPELGVVPTLAAPTVVGAIVLGVAVVGAAPLLTLRKLRHMDVPSTLRVME